LVGKTSAAAQKWAKAIHARECQKLYLARVSGRFPGRALSLAIPQLGRNNCPLPQHGEWPQFKAKADEKLKNWKKNASSKNDTGASAKIARQCFAHGYWITGPDNCAKNESLDSFCNGLIKENSVSTEEWAKALTERSWLHLACPARVEQAKIGVCVCGTFEELDDETYLRTVKPAETSFTTLTYDQSTDTSIILCRPETG